MAEYYFDHPEHGATVACDTNEARRLMGYGWKLREVQPHGIIVPDEINPQRIEPPQIAGVCPPDPIEQIPVVIAVPEAGVFPVKPAARRGRPPKAA